MPGQTISFGGTSGIHRRFFWKSGPDVLFLGIQNRQRWERRRGSIFAVLGLGHKKIPKTHKVFGIKPQDKNYLLEN